MSNSLKALTIRQPWASTIIAGDKRVENRTWRTDYRGPLVIHAGLVLDPVGVELLRSSGYWVDSDAPRGAILGVVDLVEVCAPNRRVNVHPLVTGPWCWILTRNRALPEPVRWRGKQGLWPVDPAAVPGLCELIIAN